LHCASKIIRSESGTIVSYDGDRIMAIFIGANKESQATRAAMKINFACIYIINPQIPRYYNNSAYQVRHTIGIDASSLFVSRTGIRNWNDLVWVGQAANHAAKLCSLSNNYAVSVTAKVYYKLPEILKVSNRVYMWDAFNWNTYNRVIYRTAWTWPIW
ncbi:adenylate/guanylate cyclase domain-containing protein, partial [Gammaproteobacteria bacterium]|nr:adenylate/guanylate cyclase domain-containing protein [Gammaproteobacteria bacterium]